MNEWNYNDEVVPVFPYHIQGEVEESDQPHKKVKVEENKNMKKTMFSTRSI